MSNPIVNCPECETPLVNVPSGAVCPACGKSGILPRVSKNANKDALRAMRVGRLPVARRLTTIKAARAKESGFLASSVLYALPGYTVIWRRIQRQSSLLSPSSAADNAILAYDPASCRVVELSQYVAATHELQPQAEEQP